MRKQHSLFILINFILFYSSCKKDSSKDIPTNPASYPLSFKIDGTLLNMDSTKVTLYSYPAPPYDRRLDILGYKDGKVTFEASLQAKIGKQALGDASGSSVVTYRQGLDLDQHFSSKNGNFIFTEFDTINNKFKGEFDAMMQKILGGPQTLILSEGTVNIPN